MVTISLLRTHRRSLMERKNLQMLEEAHKRLTLSMNGGKISLWNIQEGVLEFDDNYVRLVGMEQRRFTKEDIMRYTHPDDVQLLSSFYETLYQSPSMQIQRIRFCFGGKEADYQWYELRCSTLKDAQGEIMLAGIMQNIQNLVEHEQQLILAKQIAEKAELKQSFLNNMSHEIRTPLNAIVGFSGLMVSASGEEERKMYADILAENNERLLRLVNDIFDLSQIESGTVDFVYKEFDANDLLRELKGLFGMRLNENPLVTLVCEAHLEPIMMHSEKQRIIQVLTNLLHNAMKFTKTGEIRFGCHMEGTDEVCFYVSDTGIGIPEEEQEKIFSRFTKLDREMQGTGLGLTLSQIIVHNLGGRCGVESEVGKGSTFWFILPLVTKTEITTDKI